VGYVQVNELFHFFARLTFLFGGCFTDFVRRTGLHFDDIRNYGFKRRTGVETLFHIPCPLEKGTQLRRRQPSLNKLACLLAGMVREELFKDISIFVEVAVFEVPSRWSLASLDCLLMFRTVLMFRMA